VLTKDNNKNTTLMETINFQHPAISISNKAVWTGRVISALCILFLLVDAIMKIVMHPMYVEGTQKAGWDVSTVQPLGYVLLACTLLYIIPRTAIFGALLLTGYFGGAIATVARLGDPFYFPLIFSALVWGGLYLRDERLRTIARKLF
jgi:hypothetical protein